MKLAHLFVAAALPLALTGCTVNHYHYYGSDRPVSQQDADQADIDRRALIEELHGVHTAIELTTQNIHYAGINGYKPHRARFIHGQTQPVISVQTRLKVELIETDSRLDLAIVGDGFLEFEHPYENRGTVYTRNGRLSLNKDNELVWGDADGPLLTNRIVVPEDAVDLKIQRDGLVLVTLPHGSEEQIGRIELHRFVNKTGLRAIGNNFYATTPDAMKVVADPGDDGLGRLMQSRLEGCGVDIDFELHQLTMLSKWKNELMDTLNLSAADRYRLSHLPVHDAFFEELAANRP